ncbi:hypothetical protein MSPP1_003068 [Malassezia sp. CBS 17886]|nr:hypothetical protein MSPP1_003068 [Malassezia sp. CBS 17886]
MHGDDADWLASDDERGDHASDAARAMEERDRRKMELQFHDMGYREGIEHGKLAALQMGFDDGYNTVGVPLGRALGILRGRADALSLILTHVAAHDSRGRSGHANPADADAPHAPSGLGDASHGASCAPREAACSALETLRHELRQIALEDVAEPDWDAVAHGAEHHMDGDRADTLAQQHAAWHAQGDQVSVLQARLAAIERALL